MHIPSLGQEDPLEEGMSTNSNTLVWKIAWIEEPGRLQSIQSQRVGHKEYNMKNAGLEEAQAGIKIAGEISITSDMQMTPSLWQKVKRN